MSTKNRSLDQSLLSSSSSSSPLFCISLCHPSFLILVISLYRDQTFPLRNDFKNLISVFLCTCLRGKIRLALYLRNQKLLDMLVFQYFHLNALFFRLYFHHSHRNHVSLHLLIHQCQPVLDKYITISSLPKTCYNSKVNSSGDFYASLLTGHHSMFWYCQQ